MCFLVILVFCDVFGFRGLLFWLISGYFGVLVSSGVFVVLIVFLAWVCDFDFVIVVWL